MQQRRLSRRNAEPYGLTCSVLQEEEQVMNMSEQARKRQALASWPATNSALQAMIAAMADAENSRGKRTLIGRDKAVPAYSKFLECFKAAINAALDEHLLLGDDSMPIVGQFIQMLEMFSEAYPNWPEAYRFASRFFAENNQSNVAEIVGEVLAFRDYLERPLICRSRAEPEQDGQNEWWKRG